MSDKMGKFKHGASEFQSYWLPMIIFYSINDENQMVANMMLFKYRKPCLTKEEASTISENELNNVLSLVSDAEDYNEKAIRIVRLIKSHHYYPAPEDFLNWENEWNIKNVVM